MSYFINSDWFSGILVSCFIPSIICLGHHRHRHRRTPQRRQPRPELRGARMRSAALAALFLAAQSADASRRILLLHGSGSSASAFMNRGGKGLIGAASAAYHDGGPHAWQIEAVDWDIGIDAATDYGAWWVADAPSSAEASAAGDKAVWTVEEAVRSGGFHGIVGFAEGAALAAVVAARAALGEDGACPLRFAVMCSGAVPKHYERLLERAAAADGAAALPTMHLISEADAVMPADQGARLASLFPGAEVLWHEAGHAMPPKLECKQIITFCDRVVPQGSKYR